MTDYNPFEMWGAYFGGIIAVLMPVIVEIDIGLELIDPSVFIIVLLTLLSVVISFMIGFLIGWGIHSLIRRLIS